MSQKKATPTKRGASGRGLKVRVKTARGRPIGSQIWLQRQLNDPYVARARAEGYRSLREDGLIKAWRGMTSIDEVLRVTGVAEDEE